GRHILGGRFVRRTARPVATSGRRPRIPVADPHTTTGVGDPHPCRPTRIDTCCESLGRSSDAHCAADTFVSVGRGGTFQLCGWGSVDHHPSMACPCGVGLGYRYRQTWSELHVSGSTCSAWSRSPARVSRRSGSCLSLRST